MISVWQRMKRVMTANAHVNVDRLEAPEAMLDQLQRELVAAVTQGRAAVASARSWERRIAERTAKVRTERDGARAVAKTALKNDDEAMAHSAMERVLSRDAELHQLTDQAEQASKLVARQSAQLDKLRNDLAQLKEKRVSLHAVGESSVEMAEPIALVVERMEERVAFHEAAADVSMEMDDSGGEAELNKYIKNSSVEDALAELRLEINNTGDEQ